MHGARTDRLELPSVSNQGDSQNAADRAEMHRAPQAAIRAASCPDGKEDHGRDHQHVADLRAARPDEQHDADDEQQSQARRSISLGPARVACSILVNSSSFIQSFPVNDRMPADGRPRRGCTVTGVSY